MKKRILALFLCLLMIFAVFAGCGSNAADMFATEFSSCLKDHKGSAAYRIENGKLYFDDEPCNCKSSGNKLVLMGVISSTDYGEKVVMDIELTKIS